MPPIRPTFEQICCVDAFDTGESLVVRALAGTGKTTTLKMLAHAAPRNAQGAYLAYNRAIADDAKGSFPGNTTCRTAHSFAFAAVGDQYRERLDSPRLPLWEIAEILKLRGTTKLEGRTLAPQTVARIAADTVLQYCYSADEHIDRHHVPPVKGIDTYQQRRLMQELVVPAARKYWEDLQLVKDGRFKFTHDHYLKIWGLSRPHLPFDFILFDEAQDANPVISKIVEDQVESQRVAVGDSNQQIYEWRGAVDAMNGFLDDELLVAHHGMSFGEGFDLTLTQSFRFGLEIADAANWLLAKLPTKLRVVGNEEIDDDVTAVPWPRTLLCRTNAGAIETVMNCLTKSVPVALVGGAADVIRFCREADKLKAGKQSIHEDLCAFRTWLEVQEYVEDEQIASDLGRLVKLVEAFSTERIIAALEKTVSEARAQVIVSTGHKAKGREWDSVRLHSDFEKDEGDESEPKPPSDSETRLRYVAATRAKRLLDLGPLMSQYRPVIPAGATRSS